ncbi:MAG TPA: hypothetical protein VN039_16145, partial [Nitrospira sp.]|nr:hypothetical protein [Nitrospira sp.]
VEPAGGDLFEHATTLCVLGGDFQGRVFEDAEDLGDRLAHRFHRGFRPLRRSGDDKAPQKSACKGRRPQ